MPLLSCGDRGWPCWGYADAAGDGAGPAVVPPSAPSWQLLLNLLFIACQKRPGCFLLPPLSFNPDFHHSPDCACPPLRARHHRVGGQEPCRAQPGAQARPRGSALPNTRQNHPKCSPGCGVGLPVVGGSLESNGLNPRDLGDALDGSCAGEDSGPAAEVLPARKSIKLFNFGFWEGDQPSNSVRERWQSSIPVGGTSSRPRPFPELPRGGPGP